MTTTLSAFGVPLEPRPASYARQAAAPTRPLQRTEVARLLERIEARLESRDDGDAWKGASLAVSLYHAREQVEALAHDDTQQRGQGSTSQLLTSTAALRAKLQRLESTFQSRQAVVVNTVSLLLPKRNTLEVPSRLAATHPFASQDPPVSITCIDVKCEARLSRPRAHGR